MLYCVYYLINETHDLVLQILDFICGTVSSPEEEEEEGEGGEEEEGGGGGGEEGGGEG